MFLIKNSILISSSRFFNRGLGLFSTLIVARMLSPDDYGVIAACMLVQELGRRFTKLGIDKNLISSSDTSVNVRDSLFLFGIIIGGTVSLVIYVISPYVSIWLNDDRITDVLRILCWMFFFGSISNFNCQIEIRNNNFKPEIISSVTSKIFQVVVTVTCAYAFQDYWALVSGIMTACLVQCVASYLVVKPYYIQTFSLSLIFKNLSYSKWFLMRELMDYCNSRLGQILSGMYFNSATLGFLSMGRDLSTMLSSEVCAALDKSNFSHLSALIKSDGGKINNKIIMGNIKQVLFVKNLIIVPCYFCLLFYPELIIRIILGEHWLAMAPYCRLYACYAILSGYNFTFLTIFDCLRKPQIVTVATVMDLFSTLLFAIPAILYKEPLFFVYSIVFNSFFVLVWYVFNLIKILNVKVLATLNYFKSTLITIFSSIVIILFVDAFDVSEMLKVVLTMSFYYPVFYLVTVRCKDQNQIDSIVDIKNRIFSKV